MEAYMPCTGTSKGYPVILLKQILKASNGLSTMAAMLLVILSGDPSLRGVMRAIQQALEWGHSSFFAMMVSEPPLNTGATESLCHVAIG
jgi:hypothetical protein